MDKNLDKDTGEVDALGRPVRSKQEDVLSDKDRKRQRRVKRTLITMVLLVVIGLGVNLYIRWFGNNDIEELNNNLIEWEQAILEEKTNDTVGGVTPQETLDMFISAVEAGDYDLASKYFVIERQGEELASLQNSEKENIDNIMGILKKTDYSGGEYSEDEESFSIHDPIFIGFIKYPKGNWKIEKI